MSYDLYVFDVDEPDLDRIHALLEDVEIADDAPLTPALARLCAELEAATAFDDEDSLGGTPWASWPLAQPMAGGRGCAFNIVWSEVEAGADAVTAAAARHALVLYDPQEDVLVEPGQTPSLPPGNWWEPQQPPPAPRKRWWRRG